MKKTVFTKMKFKILFDNYYLYMIILAVYSIFKSFWFGDKMNFGAFLVLGILWLSQLIFDKKMYLLNMKIDENSIELTYLNIFLQENRYLKDRDLIVSINSFKNNSFFRKNEVLQVVEKDSFRVLKFEITDKNIEVNVQKSLNQ